MTEDRLKGSVTLSRTFNLGNFRSAKIEFTKEFYLDEATHEDVLRELDSKISETLLGAEMRTTGGHP